ncbi:MAG: hypothetical protein PHV74_02650 [Dehalococcoidia bacterium]|nr:hypothetical protein [Dehalococcoidia bacterium]
MICSVLLFPIIMLPFGIIPNQMENPEASAVFVPLDFMRRKRYGFSGIKPYQ